MVAATSRLAFAAVTVNGAGDTVRRPSTVVIV
jgi:hypothetical protein